MAVASEAERQEDEQERHAKAAKAFKAASRDPCETLYPEISWILLPLHRFRASAECLNCCLFRS